jgi:hypothetical protein
MWIQKAKEIDMGNHEVGRSLAASAKVFWKAMGDRPVTKEAALEALDLMAEDFIGADAEFDDEMTTDTALTRLVALAFEATPEEIADMKGELDEGRIEDQGELWYDGPYRKFSDRYKFCWPPQHTDPFNKGQRGMSIEWRMAAGFYFTTAGNAGYERYMLQGNITGAVFDAVLAILGMIMLAGAFKASRATPLSFNKGQTDEWDSGDTIARLARCSLPSVVDGWRHA